LKKTLASYYAFLNWRLLLEGLIAVLLATLLWVQPLFFDRLIPQVDSVTHLRWSSQFFAALADGWIQPRWAFASHGGLGDPTFLYYQPGLYYLTSLLAFAGLSAEGALIWAAWLPYVVTGFIVFGVVRRTSLIRSAVFGVAFVVSCPALFFLSTHSGAFPWVMATPFCILFVLESIKDRPTLQNVAIWLALICLSHLLSGMMVLLCTGVARLIFSFPTRQTLYGHLVWGCGIILGMALAAFYLYPALSQQHLINPTGWTDDPTLDWRRSFAFPIITYMQYGFRWFSIQWPLPLLALAMTAVVFSITRKSNEALCMQMGINRLIIARRLAIVAVVGLFLSSELVYPLYYFLGPLQKLQWPYRFVVLCLVLSSLAFSLVAFPKQTERPKLGVTQIIIVMIVMVHCVFSAYLQYNLLKVGRPLPSLASAMQGEFGQPEYLPATRGKEWALYNESGKFPGYCQKLGLQCKEMRQGSHTFSVNIETAKDAEIRLPIFAFPGWRVTVNGSQQPLSIDSNTGLALIKLSPGTHDVFMYWGGIKSEAIGIWISLAAFAVLACVVYRRRLTKLR
jgi:hypothetical protein